MPRVELYPGDRVRTAPRPGLRRSATPPVPTADVFGGQFGETLTRVGGVVAQIHDEQQKRATELLATTAERQLNDLYQQQGLSSERGTLGTRGLFTMVGLEPQEKLEANLKDYDAQIQEIVKQAKTPEQRVLLERMTTQARQRYVETGLRHASAEYAKYETGQTQALLVSSAETAGAAAGTEGGLEVIAEQLARQRDIITQHGHKIGLFSPEQQQNAINDLRSKTHVLAIEKLLSSDKAHQADEYFTEVMTPTPEFPKGQILESQAAALRTKLEVNTTDAKAMRIATDIQQRLGPKPGDRETPVPTADMQAEAKRLATGPDGKFNGKLYERIRAYNLDYESAVEGQRTNQTNAIGSALLRAYQREVPLATVREMDAFKNADGTTQAAIVDKYEARRRGREADIRAQRDQVRADQLATIQTYQFQQFLRDRDSQVDYRRFTNPAYLSGVTREQLETAMITARMSDDQMAQVLTKWEQVYGNVVAAAGAQADRKLIDQMAYDNGVKFSFDPQGDDEEAAMSRLYQAVDVRVQQEELALAKGTGRRQPLGEARTREIVQSVLDVKIATPGMFGSFFGENEAVLAMVKTDDATGRRYLPIAKVKAAYPMGYAAIIKFIQGEPVAAGVLSTRGLQEPQIAVRYQRGIEEAALIIVNGGSEAEWKKVLRTEIGRHRGGR